MDKYIFKNSIIVGGLLNLNDRNIELRSLQIKDNLTIHTCNDYGQSLEVIKEASFKKINKVKIISKVYYNYPNTSHKRFRPIFKQLEEQISRLGFVPKQWSIQICCFCPLNNLMTKRAQCFFKKIKDLFGIEKIFLETYPIYNYKNDQIELLNYFYKDKYKFGLIGYQNFHNRIFKETDLKKFEVNLTEIIFIGILGKGIQNKIRPKNFNKEFIDKNLIYFLSNKNSNQFIRGITNFSSQNQYKNFIVQYSKIQNELKNIKQTKNLIKSSKEQIYYFEKYDHYGGLYSLKKYLDNPKLILFQIKRIISSFLKSIKFSNNFFG